MTKLSETRSNVTRSMAMPSAIILTGVLAGAVSAAWLTEVALAGRSALWLGYHHAITAAYTRALPPIGVLALLAAAWTLPGARHNIQVRRLLMIAVGCLLAGLLITVFVHFPLNAQIASWPSTTPPEIVEPLRERWVLAHGLRAVAVLAAFILLVATAFRENQLQPNSEAEDSASPPRARLA